MKKIIIGNWKLNPTTLARALQIQSRIHHFVKKSRRAFVILAPPFPFLHPLVIKAKGLHIAAQNSFWEATGAYTGEVSPAILRSINVRYVIIGHSERREYMRETDAQINKKVKTALKSGLTVILCIGEKSRDEENFQKIVKNQLFSDIKGVAKTYAHKIIIAYEPVWAIGTGKTVHPADLYEMAMYIRRALFDVFGKKAAHSIPVLYGGSVHSKNAGDFLAVDGVDGLLVGGASLDPKEFGKIIEIAAKS